MTGGGAAPEPEGPQAFPPPPPSLPRPPPPVLIRAAPDAPPPPLPHAEAPFPAITEFFFNEREREKGGGAVEVEVFGRQFFFSSSFGADGTKKRKARSCPLSLARSLLSSALRLLLALVTRESPAARSSSWCRRIFRSRVEKGREGERERERERERQVRVESVKKAWQSIELHFAFSSIPLRSR